MSLRQWSTESIVADHSELQCSSLSLGPGGNLVALAGKRYLALINLGDPTQVVKRLPRGTRWDSTKLSWSPSTLPYLALATNDKIEIYQYENSDLYSLEPIKGHCRQISDVCWRTVDPGILSSTAGDGYINIWDVRDYRRPRITFQTMVGASQIQWSRCQPHYLAGAHEGDIKLWDTRQPSSSLSTLSIHLSRIHSLDWMHNEEGLVSSSADCTVKFPTISDSSLQSTEKGLTTSIPVWRAKFTPFGQGMLTVLVPHLGTSEHSIFLWNTENLNHPIHTFVGHRDVVLDFDWRQVDEGLFQLVSWSRDQSLRIWNLTEETVYRCGAIPLIPEPSEDFRSVFSSVPDTAKDALQVLFSESPDESKHSEAEAEDTPSALRVSSASVSVTSLGEVQESPVREHSPKQSIPRTDSLEIGLGNTLHQEFALLDTNFSYLRIVEKDIEKRVCRILVNTQNIRLILLIGFPPAYPLQTAPVFSLLKGSMIKYEHKVRLIKLLQETAQNQVARNRACLERCLRTLEYQLASINQELNSEVDKVKQSFPFHHNLTFQDNSVPYPRTAGSRFCSNGLLVCFGRPAYRMKVKTISSTGPTPRAYSAYISQVAGRTDSFVYQNITVNSFADSQERQMSTLKTGRFKVKRVGSSAVEEKPSRRRRSLHVKTTSVAHSVTVYNVERLLPISTELAENYEILDDTVQMCEKNSEIMEKLERSDLAYTWRVLGAVGRSAQDQPGHQNWSQTPLGSNIVKSILRHYAKCHDIQTMALIICAFTKQAKLIQESPVKSQVDHSTEKEKFWFLRQGALTFSGGLVDSPYHTVHAGHFDMTHRSPISSPQLQGKIRNGGSDPNLEKINTRNLRSNSWTDTLLEDARSSPEGSPPTKSCVKANILVKIGEAKFGLLPPSDSSVYVDAINAYANLLYNWGKLQKRCEVLKHGGGVISDEVHLLTNTCTVCSLKIVAGSSCSCCRTSWLVCQLCRLPVSGLSCVCSSCGHGGHAQHWITWFQNHDDCPSGCGCTCSRFMQR